MVAISTMEDIIFNIEKEVEHLNWLNQLADTFLLQEAFMGEIDPRYCDFGQWYDTLLHSEELLLTTNTFQRIFHQLKEPHRLLHDTAQAI